MATSQDLRRPRPAPAALSAIGWLTVGFVSAVGAGILAISMRSAGVGSADQDVIVAIILESCIGYIAARRDPAYFVACLSGVAIAFFAAYTWLMWALGAWS